MKNIFCEASTLKNEAAVEKNFVDRMLTGLGYSDSDIRLKTSIVQIKVGKGSKSGLFKPDYILLDRNVPIVVIDAKAPDEKLDDWTLQCSSYCLELNKRFNYNPVRYYILTNGFSSGLYSWDKDEPLLTLSFTDFQEDNSKYKKLTGLVSRRSIGRLIEDERDLSEAAAFAFAKVDLDELISRFYRIHQYIWKKEKKKPSSVFEELIKLVFVKIRKDRDIHDKYGHEPQPLSKDVVFSARWIDAQTESENPVNDLLFHRLVKDLEADIEASRKKRIFDADEHINLSPDTIRWVVQQLEHVDLFGMEDDVHGRMFESFLEATTRGQELGQFFTPRDVVRLMVGLADIDVSKSKVSTVLDACCGSGGFLIQAMAAMLDKVNSLRGLSNLEKSALTDIIKNSSLYGIDAGSDPKIYRIARMNMYLHGDGGSNIYFADSLDKRLATVGRTSVEYKQETQELRSILLEEGKKFDVILSNPPFSLKYSVEDADQAEVMDQYDLRGLGNRQTKSLLSSVMFLERYRDLVSPEGHIYAVIDESVLSGESYSPIRDWIRTTFIIEGVISLPGDAFSRSAARVKTSILILRKKMPDEEQPEVFLAYSVRIGIERKTAKRIGIKTADLQERKELEIQRIVHDFREFRAGRQAAGAYPASTIKDRMDVKFCLGDSGRKKHLWLAKGRNAVRFGEIVDRPSNRRVEVTPDDEYQFLRVTYGGEVTEGDVIPGLECSYKFLYRVKEWDILISNMGVGRGAIGIVAPRYTGNYVSSEYTVLTAKSKEEAVYYSNLFKTKEILGDILTTTTGMNRGRIDWRTIANVEVPEYSSYEGDTKELVERLEMLWQAHSLFSDRRKAYVNGVAKEMDLNGDDAQERWLGFKPPE